MGVIATMSGTATCGYCAAARCDRLTDNIRDIAGLHCLCFVQQLPASVVWCTSVVNRQLKKGAI